MADQKVNKVEFSLNSLAVPGTIGGANANRTVATFNATQQLSSTVASDKYTRFLKDFAPLSAANDPAEKLGARAISVFHQLNMGGTVGVAAQGIAVFTDWIVYGVTAATAPPIDPITNTRHFRLRATIKRAITADEFARTTTAGTLYAQRQHSIEV